MRMCCGGMYEIFRSQERKARAETRTSLDDMQNLKDHQKSIYKVLSLHIITKH